MAEDSGVTAPGLLRPGHSYATVSDQISAQVLRAPTRRGWLILLVVAALMALAFLYTLTLVMSVGAGLMGVNIPVAWGWPLVNVVWWIGIGHAGTLISAILLLFHQPWRASINRFAEAMTLFAAGIAGLFPLVHLGRPWFVHWLVPYPNTMELWPQWRSPLVWDFAAIFTYITVSVLFWYLGLMPDLATLRDRARRRSRRVIYGMLALGWRGSAIHWARYRMTYLLLAVVATPLVVSVHSVISLDFAVTLVPGYHSTIFPPYFVAGALFSGLAMVITIAVPLRAAYRLHDFIRPVHFDNLAKLMLAAGMVVAYGYLAEFFTAWYSASEPHRYMLVNRALGPYAWAFWTMLALNVLAIQPLWWRRVRLRLPWLLAIAVLVNVGMWLERYVIVITSTHRDYLPGAWDVVQTTAADWALLLGSLGLFVLLMLVFIRFLPAISIFEMRELIHDREEERR